MDIFGNINERIGVTIETSAVNFITLARALIEKGVLTPEEINKARAWATNYFDQKMAEVRDEVKKEMEGK